MAAPDDAPLSIGQVAEEVGCESWRIRRLFERGLLPEPQRLGTYRMFHRGDIPAIRAAALQAGYKLRSAQARAIPA